MKLLTIRPDIYTFQTAAEFAAEFQLGAGDLVITNKYLYEPYFGAMNLGCSVLYQEQYGAGEPSDDMVEAMLAGAPAEYGRVIGIGGGTIIDISKLFALKRVSPVEELYSGAFPAEKAHELVIVPTTCGTGSEVTNISILALNRLGTKKGLAVDALYADSAVLVPELLSGLPFGVFATSSIDALIHAIESSLSPKATPATKMFGYRAIEMILKGYQVIREGGRDARVPLMGDFLLASHYAGIAFGNAGTGAVHAMSYPLGAAYHVAHGESNYAMFNGVMKNYMEIRSDGAIAELNEYMAGILGCAPEAIYDELEELLSVILTRKPLHEYGMKEEEIEIFADSVLENQQRLLANNFVPLDRARLIKIYRELY